MIIFLLGGCANSLFVSGDNKPNDKTPIDQQPVATPPVDRQPIVTPEIFDRPIITSQLPDSNVWEHLGKTRSGDCYYSKTIIKKSSDIISVQTYKIVTEDLRKDTIEEVKKSDLAKSKKYQYYEHNIRVDEIDCQKKLYRVTESIDYDDNGNVLNRFTYTNEPWKSIPVLTGQDSLREKFCVVQKQPLKKKKKK